MLPSAMSLIAVAEHTISPCIITIAIPSDHMDETPCSLVVICMSTLAQPLKSCGSSRRSARRGWGSATAGFISRHEQTISSQSAYTGLSITSVTESVASNIRYLSFPFQSFLASSYPIWQAPNLQAQTRSHAYPAMAYSSCVARYQPR